MQKQYWASMVQWKYELLCMENMFRRNVSTARYIKIVIALISSAAVATWTIWDKYSVVWGAIIIIGQIFSVIYEHTPYQSRISRLSQAITKLQDLFLEVEGDWLLVSNGDLTEEEISELRCDYAKQWNRIQDQAFPDDWTGVSVRESRMIDEETNRYFANLYGG